MIKKPSIEKNFCHLNLDKSHFFRRFKFLKISLMITGAWPNMKQQVRKCLVVFQLIEFNIFVVAQVMKNVFIVYWFLCALLQNIHYGY